jgi:hypothetical protein
MKRILSYFFVVLALAFCGCSKVDDAVNSPYSESQLKALTMMTGTFNSESTTLDSIMGEYTTISFTKTYSEPIHFYKEDYVDGQVLLFSAHGECTYISTVSTISCYFNISDDADKLTLYFKGGNGDKKQYSSFNLKIYSADKFYLQYTDSKYYGTVYLKQN